MKILFAVSNENIAETIKKEYQSNYKQELITKNVYYFNAIIKELQNNKTYDVVIISEDLEPFANNNYDTIDKFLVDKLKTIREEATNMNGKRVSIIFIATDRHIAGDFLTSKLYEVDILNGLIGNDRSIENVCTLMFHPRTKVEARNYYRVNAEQDLGTREDDVKEDEIKSIIAHYKKLGREEEKYVESFDNIVAQYNDAQLKVIIRFLPLNVKAVLEAQSTKYQALTTFAVKGKNNKKSPTEVKNDYAANMIKEKTVEVNTNNERMIENISELKTPNNVIIPNAKNFDNVKKISFENIEIEAHDTSRRVKDGDIRKEEPIVKENVLPGFEEYSESEVEAPKPTADPADIDNLLSDLLAGNTVDNVETSEEPAIENEPVIETIEKNSNMEDINFEGLEEIEQPVKKGRGRPKKPIDPNAPVIEKIKRGRGRPKKEETVFEVETENFVLPMGEDTNVTESAQSSVDDFILPMGEDIETIEDIKQIEEPTIEIEDEYKAPTKFIEKESGRYENIEYLIPTDKKVVSFIGTSKSGTSFMVNSLAKMLATFNINVAILDMTKNRNSFYIATKNQESVRNIAEKSIHNLMDGVATGVTVTKNLTVYTAVPTEEKKFYEADKVLKTLIDNYSVVLIDTDYETPVGYFDNSTDIMLVQNMDILTMQPLTTFLKDLKAKEILKEEKISVIVNMETKVKGINAQVIVGALAVYKDPGMSYTVDLFNRANVRMHIVPFSIEAYNKYLQNIVECEMSLNGFPNNIVTNLKIIATAICPTLVQGDRGMKGIYVPPSLNKYK